mgnify:CR=1 FL=1
MINSMAADGLEDAQPVRAVVRRGGNIPESCFGCLEGISSKMGKNMRQQGEALGEGSPQLKVRGAWGLTV